MTFSSPLRKGAIEIWQTRFANEFGTRVEFVSSQHRTVLYERRGESIIYFVHVSWAPDEMKVGVLATGYAGFGVAFDTKEWKEIPFESIREDLARSIAATYIVPNGDDPIEWAATSDAPIAFLKVHPEVRLSYR